MNQNTRNTGKGKHVNRGSVLPLMLFFPITIFFSEIITRLFTYGDIEFKQLVYIFFFSVSGGALISCILSLIKNKLAVKIVSIVLLSLILIVSAAHVVYFNIFGDYFEWGNFGMAGDAMTQFTDMLFKEGIFPSLPAIFLLALSLVIFCIMRKRFTFYQTRYLIPFVPIVMAAAASLSFMIPSLVISANQGFEGDLYFYNHPTKLETPLDFGIFTAARLNIGKLLFGEKEDDVLPPFIDVDTIEPPKPSETTDDETHGNTGTDTEHHGNDTTTEEKPKPPVEYGYNVLDIDFDDLIRKTSDKTIKAMHEYFKNAKPTKKNEYTGMFEGKNLIFMSLEGFSGAVIDPELTPTLYMMAHQGFHFKNFYCSCWGGSTATGEYANLSGLFYNSTLCMTGTKSEHPYAFNYRPLSLANQLNRLGYVSKAYHANSSTYYNRDKSFPSFGYELIAGGTGIEDLKDSEGQSFRENNRGHHFNPSQNNIKPWPPSDEFTAQVTANDFINEEHFNVYYMTISGHANFTWGGNAMARLHRDEINAFCEKHNLNYCENVKAYMATQLEVELMAKKLIEELDKAGKLEDTVFVMSADHFPYALSEHELSELYGLPESGILENFDLYRNTLILWSASMKEPVEVTVPCSAIDILPTVSNLFGLPFDSRLMMGTDIMSDTEPLVILNCVSEPSWNWINKYGSYNSRKGFKLNQGYEMDSSSLKKYVKSMNNQLVTKKNYAFKILTRNYYKYLKDYFE